MRKVFKFELNLNDSPIRMPVGAKILHVDNQHENMCIWAEVDLEGSYELRHFRYFGTGELIPEGNFDYIGTILLDRGNLVMHIYEVK